MGAIDSFSKLVRAAVSLVVMSVVGAGGWFGFQAYNQRIAREQELKTKDEEIGRQKQRVAKLTQDVAARDKQILRLNLALRLLKVDHRLAQIVVRRQATSEATPTEPAKLRTEFQFQEVDDEGHPIGQPQTFTIDGKIVHVGYRIVKFADKFIETGDDPLRATSLVLFQRVYGESQQPEKGFPIDTIGTRPTAYTRGTPMNQFERELFDNFWDYANDPARSQTAGIRAIHGGSEAMELRLGKLYKITLRASDGLSITPEELPPGGEGKL